MRTVVVMGDGYADLQAAPVRDRPGAQTAPTAPVVLRQPVDVPGNQATAKLVEQTGVLPEPGMPASFLGVQRLGGYPYLQRALAPEQFRALDGGEIDRLAVPLAQLLPPDLSYPTRQQVIDDLLPGLATADGPAAEAQERVEQIARGESLRAYLEPLLRAPVTIMTEFSMAGYRVRVMFGDTEIPTDGGLVQLASLDQLSVMPLAAVTEVHYQATRQLVAISLLRARSAAVTQATGFAMEILAMPDNYALAEVDALRTGTAQLEKFATQLAQTVDPLNADLVPRVTESVAQITLAAQAARDAYHRAEVFRDGHQPDQTAGETYEDAETDYARNAHWSPSGVLSGANWAATEGWDFLGNLVTFGHQGRAKRNAQAYRAGTISWNAYEENETWNIATSLVIAAATALTAGLAGEAAAGWFSVDAGFTEAGAATLTSTVTGGATATVGAISGDVSAKIAAAITDDRYVADYQNASIVGPLGWLTAGLSGAMLGGLFGRLFGGRGTPDEPATDEPARDAVKKAVTDETIATTAPTGSSGEPVALVNGKPVPPSGYGRVFRGEDASPDVVARDGGFKAAGTNWDLQRHAEELWRFDTKVNDSAFHGSTALPGQAAEWGDWTYRIEGMPQWDVNQVMQGRIGSVGSFRGNLMYGENELAIPGETPKANITGFRPSNAAAAKAAGIPWEPGKWWTWDEWAARAPK